MAETRDIAISIPVQRIPRGYVLVAGPDGAGKSTVVDALVSRAAESGVTVHRVHHRPGLLAGRSSGRGPVTDPHAATPRGSVASALKLLVVFLDHMLGGNFQWRRKRRKGLLLVERGWYDQVVDPRRYRLAATAIPWVGRLGRVLPRPDVVLLLAGDPSALHARKPEIGAPEVRRQLQLWRDVAPLAGRRVVEVDTVRCDPQSVAGAALAALGAPGVDDRSWRAVPLTAPRLAMAMRGDARTAMSLYQPFSRRARAGFALGSRFAWCRAGAAPDPMPGLDELCDQLGLPAEGVLVLRSSTPSRLVLGLCSGGRLRTVLKVGAATDVRLRHEAEMLATGSDDGLPFTRPVLVWSGDWRGRFVVATRAFQRSSSRRWTLDEVLPLLVALRDPGLDGSPFLHGDFAPWNLVRSTEGPVLLDWESARPADEPLHDLAHFVLAEGALLGRHGPAHAVQLLSATESPGTRLLRASGLPPEAAPELLRQYLQDCCPQDVRSVRFRNAMLALVPS